MDYKAFSIEKEDNIATVIMRGPGKGNAMGPDFWRECPQVFAGLDQDPATRVVIVRGSNKTFSYGLDLLAMAQELGSIMNNPGAAERTQFLEVIREMQAALDAVMRCKKPVIAAIHGWCIGGGLDLAAAADMRLCSQNARFSLRETKVGMVADVGSLQRLPLLIGEGATRELAFTGKDIDAARALALGLVNDVLATEEGLFQAATTMAEQIAANPPLVTQGIKEVMNARVRSQIDEGLRHVATWNAAFLPSEDLQEAMASFAERRKPNFKGR